MKFEDRSVMQVGGMTVIVPRIGPLDFASASLSDARDGLQSGRIDATEFLQVQIAYDQCRLVHRMYLGQAVPIRWPNPCVSCGNTSVEIFGQDGAGFGSGWWCGCKPCSRVKVGGEYCHAPTRDAAIEKWNVMNPEQAP